MNNIYENKFKKYKSKYLKLKEYNDEGGRYIFYPSEAEKYLRTELILEKKKLSNIEIEIKEIKNNLNKISDLKAPIDKNLQKLSKQLVEQQNILEILKLNKEYNINKKIEKVFEQELNKAKEEKAKIQYEKQVFILFEELTVINKAKNKAQVLYQKAISDNIEEEILVREKQFNILTKQYNLINKNYLLALSQKQLQEQKQKYEIEQKQKQEIEQIYEHEILIRILTQINENVKAKKIKYEKKLDEQINKNEKIEKIFEEIKENEELHDLNRMLNDQEKNYNIINNEIVSEQQKMITLDQEYAQSEIEYVKLKDKYSIQENKIYDITNKIKNTYF